MAFLTMRSKRQPVATHGNGFGLISALFAVGEFATGCLRLQPWGSIKAPSSVVNVGDTSKSLRWERAWSERGSASRQDHERELDRRRRRRRRRF
jgi:hypothetical protein